MHQTFAYNDSAVTYFTGVGFAKCFADGGVDWRNSLGFYWHVGKGKWLDGLWNKKKSLWEGNKCKSWMGKILLWWRFHLSGNRMSWIVLAVPVTYPLFCLWRDMCHIYFSRSWAVWAPASLLKLFLLPCSSSLASIFPHLALADVDCEVISDLPCLDKIFILFGVSGAHQPTNRKQCLKHLGELRAFAVKMECLA